MGLPCTYAFTLHNYMYCFPTCCFCTKKYHYFCNRSNNKINLKTADMPLHVHMFMITCMYIVHCFLGGFFPLGTLLSPVGVEVTPVGSYGLLVSWSSPPAHSCFSVVGYIAECSPMGDPSDAPSASAPRPGAGNGSVVVSGLKEDTLYQCNVQIQQSDASGKEHLSSSDYVDSFTYPKGHSLLSVSFVDISSWMPKSILTYMYTCMTRPKTIFTTVVRSLVSVDTSCYFVVMCVYLTWGETKMAFRYMCTCM